MDRGFVAFLDESGLLVHKGPCGVAAGIVLEGEGLLHTVFLVDEKGLIEVGLGIVGIFHKRGQVVAYLIGPEIADGQMGAVVGHKAQRATQRQQSDAEFGRPAEGGGDMPFRGEEHHDQNEEHHVFPEGLPVGEHHGIAEAAAVADRVGERQIEREGRHEEHHQQCEPRGPLRADIEQQADAEDEFEGDETPCGGLGHREQVVEEAAEGFEVVFYLVGGAQRVNGLDEAAEDEGQAEQCAAHGACDTERGVHCRGD